MAATREPDQGQNAGTSEADWSFDAKIRRGLEQLERGEGIPEDELDECLARSKANAE